MATNAPGGKRFPLASYLPWHLSLSLSLSLSISLSRSRSLSLSLPPRSWPYTSKPGSGILGTFFHVKQRGSAQGCDATALFPLRGEEPCAVRPIPVRSKKTATFSHRFPSSARQLKTIPECLWVRGTATQAREQASGGSGRGRKNLIKRGGERSFFFFFPVGLSRLFMGYWKQTKGEKKDPTVPNWHSLKQTAGWHYFTLSGPEQPAVSPPARVSA